MLHAANIYLPKDRVTNQHMGYGFVEFRSEDDADYVCPAAAAPTCTCLQWPEADRAATCRLSGS